MLVLLVRTLLYHKFKNFIHMCKDLRSRNKKGYTNNKLKIKRFFLFKENQGGAVLDKLKDLYRPDSQPLIELIQFSDANALKLLPSAITNYR